MFLTDDTKTSTFDALVTLFEKGYHLPGRAISASSSCRNFFVSWCRLRDSNPRPTVYKTVALPLC